MPQAMNSAISHVIDEIKRFHRLGAKSRHARPEAGKYGTAAIKAESERHALNPDTMRKARAFADPDTGYDRDDLALLLAAVRASAARFRERGRAFGRSHLIRLLSVPKARGRRRKLQAKLFANAWSVAELDTAIKARFGTRRQGGRRRRIEGDLPGLLAQIDGLCEGWMRMMAELERRMEEDGALSTLDLPERVRGCVGRVTKPLAATRDSIAEHLKSPQGTEAAATPGKPAPKKR